MNIITGKRRSIEAGRIQFYIYIKLKLAAVFLFDFITTNFSYSAESSFFLFCYFTGVLTVITTVLQ
jgi:hypothetical protein